MRITKLSLGLIISVLVFVGVFFVVPVAYAQHVSDLVPCGNGGSQSACTFKDLAVLISRVIKFLILRQRYK